MRSPTTHGSTTSTTPTMASTIRLRVMIGRSVIGVGACSSTGEVGLRNRSREYMSPAETRKMTIAPATVSPPLWYKNSPTARNPIPLKTGVSRGSDRLTRSIAANP